MPAFQRDATTLSYQQSGTGAPPFLFVHGWTCNHTHFAPQIAHFARRHRVVAVDLRGHGASDAPEQCYTVPGFADDVAWLCEQAGVERPVLVGHSMGGTVVLDVAAALRALNPSLRTGQTVGAGHFNQLEVPDQVNAMIDRFLLVAVA